MKRRDIINGPLVFFSSYEDMTGDVRYNLETMWLTKAQMAQFLNMILDNLDKPKMDDEPDSFEP